jgi:hypothetical protein
MNSAEFVEAVKHYVRDVAVQDVITAYLEPPGRSPNRDLVQLSNWYNSLDESERVMVNRVVKESVDAGLFGFFCVLDGVRAVEEPEDRGDLRLTYINNEREILLNNINEEYLHDLFNEA